MSSAAQGGAARRQVLPVCSHPLDGKGLQPPNSEILVGPKAPPRSGPEASASARVSGRQRTWVSFAGCPSALSQGPRSHTTWSPHSGSAAACWPCVQRPSACTESIGSWRAGSGWVARVPTPTHSLWAAVWPRGRLQPSVVGWGWPLASHSFWSGSTQVNREA